MGMAGLGKAGTLLELVVVPRITAWRGKAWRGKARRGKAREPMAHGGVSANSGRAGRG